MPLRDLLFSLSVPLIWGMGFTFAKAGLVEFPPLMLMGLRFSLTALILVWFVARPDGMLWRLFWIALISGTVQYGLTFTGLSLIDASTAVLIVQLEVPFGALLAGIFLADKLGWQRAIGMAVAFVGVALIAGRPSVQDQLWPIFLVASGAMAWAVGQIMVKTLKGTIGGFALIAWVGVFAGPQMIGASLLIESGHVEAIRSATWVGWGTVIYLALVMTALGYGIWYHVLRKHPVNRVMPVLLLLPVTTIAGSVLFLGERPGVDVLLGGLVVIVGVAIILLYRSPKVATLTP